MLFNPLWGGLGGSCLSKGYLSESERNSASGVRTRLLRFRRSTALTISPRGHPLCSSYLMVLEMRGKWPHNGCFVGWCFQDLFNISKVKLAMVVEGDQKSPFSIATTPRCRGGRYSFLWIAPFYPSSTPYNAEC